MHFFKREAVSILLNRYSFEKNLQIAFPLKSSIQMDPGPHGEGLQGSGFGMHWFHWTSQIFPSPQCLSIKHSTQPSMESGIGTKPESHLEIIIIFFITTLSPQ